jgi:hypothetical protein
MSADICVSLPVIYFFFKETTKKSLEDIDLLFGGPVLDAGEETADGAEKDRGTAVTVENTSGID